MHAHHRSRLTAPPRSGHGHESGARQFLKPPGRGRGGHAEPRAQLTGRAPRFSIPLTRPQPAPQRDRTGRQARFEARERVEEPAVAEQLLHDRRHFALWDSSRCGRTYRRAGVEERALGDAARNEVRFARVRGAGETDRQFAALVEPLARPCVRAVARPRRTGLGALGHFFALLAGVPFAASYWSNGAPAVNICRAPSKRR